MPVQTPATRPDLALPHEHATLRVSGAEEAHKPAPGHAARFRNSEVGGQFEQRDSNALVKAEVEKTGAAQQQPVPLLQIVLMKSLEY
jgi:hypothetical protein